MLPYAIVEFVDGRSTAVVPTKWLNDEEDKCFWPRNKKGKLTSLVKNLSSPTKDWIQYAVRVLGKAGVQLSLFLCYKL
jgi:hypothetical protein